MEVMVAGDKVNNAFHYPNDGWNAGPAEDKVENTKTDPAHIEFMDAKPTEQNSKNACDDFAFNWPAGIIW